MKFIGGAVVPLTAAFRQGKLAKLPLFRPSFCPGADPGREKLPTPVIGRSVETRSSVSGRPQHFRNLATLQLASGLPKYHRKHRTEDEEPNHACRTRQSHESASESASSWAASPARRRSRLETGEAVVAALEGLGYDVQGIYVDRDIDLVLPAIGTSTSPSSPCTGATAKTAVCKGLLETLGIPYTGSDVLSSALAMHKVKAKELFRLHNLPTPSYYVMYS